VEDGHSAANSRCWVSPLTLREVSSSTLRVGLAPARNFPLIAPNIIVLDRLRADFPDGSAHFPSCTRCCPTPYFAGRNWRATPAYLHP
jgi:hypothetical protein